MGGRGSGGSRGGGGGRSVNTTNKNLLKKQINEISQKVSTKAEEQNNYNFYKSLNNTDLKTAYDITKKRLNEELDKLYKIEDHLYNNIRQNLETTVPKRGNYATRNKLLNEQQKTKSKLIRQEQKAINFAKSLDNAQNVLETRGINYHKTQ